MAPKVQNAQDKYELIISEIDKREEKLSKFLPEHLTWERSRALFQAAMTGTPKLMLCDIPSLYVALETSFKLGLEPNGPLDECYLIPYRDRDGQHHAQCQIGYKGWLKLANNSAEVLSVTANVVYREEVESGNFEVSLAPPEVKHKINPLSSTRGWTDDDIVGAYARFELANGGVVVSWMSRDDLNDKEKQSKQGWANSKQFPTRWKGMARKSAILQSFNRREVPISAEKVRLAMSQEKAIDELQQADWTEPEETPLLPESEAPRITGTEEFVSRHDKEEPEEQAKEFPF